MNLIRLVGHTAGRFAIVDDQDYAWATMIAWHYRRQGIKRNRVVSKAASLPGCFAASELGRLHHVVLDRAGHDLTGKIVRHANGFGLDCRKANLLIGTRGDNARTSARSNVRRENRISWTLNGETYSHFRYARAAARRLGVCPSSVKKSDPIKVWRAYLGDINIGTFSTLENAQAAHEQAAHANGYTIPAERKQLRAALVAELDGLVAAGVLIVADPRSKFLEDRYRLPLPQLSENPNVRK